MTIVLICIVVAVALAIVGGYLLVSGRREERSEVTGGPSPRTSSYRAPGPAPARVHRSDPEVGTGHPGPPGARALRGRGALRAAARAHPGPRHRGGGPAAGAA